jgi:tetratricopeptide (TPR) repeat protein
MRRFVALCVFLVAVVAGCLSRLYAQDGVAREEAPPTKFRPRTKQELDRLEARKQYALGLLCERDHDLLEAVKCFEKAAALDPGAAPVIKALIPVYMALDRPADALAACRKTVELDSGDYETWYVYAGQLRANGKLPEALTALRRARDCPAARDNLEAFAQIATDLAHMYEEGQDYTQAIVVLDDLLKVLEKERPEARPAEIYEQLGQISAKAGKHDRAITAFEKAQALMENRDPFGSRRLDYPLAREYSALGKRAEALCKLDAYLLTQPSAIEPYEFKVRLLKQLRKADQIVPALQTAAERDPNNVALKLYLAQQYIRANEKGLAEQLFLKLASDAPTPDVYRGLFTLYAKDQRVRETLALLDSAIAAGVDTDERSGDGGARARARAMVAALEDDKELAAKLLPAAAARLHDQQAMQAATRQFLAVVATRAENLTLAEDLYRSCLTDSVAPRNEAALYDGLLRVLWVGKKYQAVVDLCRQGLDSGLKMTHRLLLHTNLARALVLLGKTDEAVAEADQAVQLSDTEDRLHFRLMRVTILELAERLDQAESDCLALLKEGGKPEDVRQIRYTLSGVHAAARQPAKAEEQLRLILQDFPDDAAANNDLGYQLADQNQNLEEAEKLIRKAIELDREQRKADQRIGADDDKPNAAYIDSLGWVLFRSGRLREARREMERAVALPEGAADPVVWDHLGDVYFRMGDKERTAAAWKKALTLYETDKRRRLDDSYKELKHKLQLLESEPHH